MASCHIPIPVVLGVFLFAISISAYPYDPFNINDDAGEYNPYFQTGYYYGDDQNEINYPGIGDDTGGSSSRERGGGGGGVWPQTPIAKPPVRPTMRLTARPTVRPIPTVRPTFRPNPGPTTPCRGDTCGGGVPVGPVPRNGPGKPVPRSGPIGPVPRADPGGPVPRTDKPKIFTISNNIAKSKGNPLNMSFPNLVAAVAVGGVLLVSAAGITAYVMAKRR